MYTFKEQHKKGTAAEQLIDEFISDKFHYKITPVSLELQLLGADRIWYTPAGFRYLAEYKTDTYTNGNMFIEVIQNQRTNSIGWAYSSVANYLVYYLINMDRLYILDMQEFKRKFEGWIEDTPRKAARSKAGTAYGIPFPLETVVENMDNARVYHYE